MSRLSSLLSKLPQFKEARMVASGYGLWVNWNGDLNPSIVQTFQDYGGLHLATERGQALWFFFSTDVFLALARLEIWGKFNRLPVFTQVFSAKLLFSSKREINLSVDTVLAAQTAIVPEEFEVWVHPRAKDEGKGLPGLSFEERKPYTGLASAEWSLLHADSRLPYQSSLGWYGVLKPLGNPLEKGFQAGWREFFKEVEQSFQRLKIKFMLFENYVFFQVDNLRTMRLWCKEYLQLIASLKEEASERYWPCVQALVDRKGLNFNNELHKKVRLDWDQLVPDFPHMSYRNAYLMGEGFEVHDTRFNADSSSVDDWCNINLTLSESDTIGILPVDISNRLVAGAHNYCFYCGLRTHEPAACPTRPFEDLDSSIWNKVAAMDFETINTGFRTIDAALQGDVHEGVQTVLGREGLDNVLLRAVFSVTDTFQLRMMRRMWLARGKDYPKGVEELAPKDDNPVWGTLNTMLAGELIPAEKELQQVVIRFPRDFRSRTINGFIAMERGDLIRAQQLWKEAESFSTSPLLQAYHVFLQGRNLEIQGRFQQASNMYKQVLRLCPLWLEALYRQAVCQVKMGFADQAMGFLLGLIDKDPHMFNRVLLDPEMERGHIQILSALNVPWTEAEAKAGQMRDGLEKLRLDIATWFPEEHPFAEQASARISRLLQLAQVKNFVPFMGLLQGRERLDRDMQMRINQEARDLKQKFKYFLDRLAYIRDEAAWFPFPGILIEFNKQYNMCAANLNWALKTHFQVAETFKRAQKMAEVEEERLKLLESRLRFLRVVRDATLFMLIMGKTFFWLELVFMLLTLIGLPLTIYYGQTIMADWATDLVVKQKWQIQKGLILILSVLALGVAALRTAVVFEKVREKLFRKARGLG